MDLKGSRNYWTAYITKSAPQPTDTHTPKGNMKDRNFKVK